MKKIKLSQVKLGAMISYLALGVNILAGLLYTPWMVDKIGQSNYGLYTLANSLIGIFMLDFGLGSAVSRFVSKYRAEGDLKGANNIMGLIYKLYFAIDAVIFVVLAVLFFFLEAIYTKLTPAELDLFRVLYVIVAGFNVVSFPCAPLNGVLNSYEKFIQLKSCDLFHKLFTVVCVVIALNFSNSVVLVVAANVASSLLTILIKLVIVKSTVPLKANLRASGADLYKTLFGFTVWTAIINIMQRFTHSFAPSVLGMTASSLEIAVYAPAVTLEGYFYALSMAVNGLFLPRVSRHIANKEEDKILPLMVKVGRYQILFLGLVFVGFVCVGRDFMVLWMGPEYEKTYYCTMIILLPTLISASMQIAGTTVIAKNLIRYQAIWMIISGTIGLALSYVLSIYVGAIGVCIGTATTALANTVFNNVIYKKKAGINMTEFYKKCYPRAIPVYGVALAFGFLVLPLVPLTGWLGLVVKAAMLAVVFLAMCLVCGLTAAERKGLFNKLLRRG
ncbi:MAG: oligosaccharide flippase family protein [Clostridia bacterium]|nr:oligosaccharide flippase family protein [Clostridia bacterium]